MNIEQQIYTSCPHGEGYDQISGFQVKARSVGITDAMSQAILRYSNHYIVPSDLRSQELDFYQEGENLPSEFLDRFPVTVTYHRVTDHKYGLTQVRYVGRDYSGRSGNFQAHTLVFTPEKLAPFDYNPIALSRSTVFQNPQIQGTTLASLTSLSPFATKYAAAAARQGVNDNRNPYAYSYQEILPALIRQQYLERPIILCFKEYNVAVHYIHDLLMMLPPSMRCRFTFTTYEPTPYTLIKRGNSQDDTENLHLVTTISQEQGGRFEFLPHEINQFLVKDFTGEHSSTFPSPSTYTKTIIQLSADLPSNQSKRKQHHTFLEEIGAGCLPETWDALILAVEIESNMDLTQNRQLIPTVLEAVAKTAQTEPQVNRALAFCWPLLQKSTAKKTDDLFPTTQHAFSQLFSRLPEDSAYRQEIKKKLVKLAVDTAVSGVLPRALLLVGNDIKMIELLLHNLWQKVTSSVHRDIHHKDYSNLLDALKIFLDKLPPNSAIKKQIASQVYPVIYSQLKNGFSNRALSLLNLFCQETQDPLIEIYYSLIEEGWPAGLTPHRIPPDHNPEAFKIIIEKIIKKILGNKQDKRQELQTLMPAFKTAHLYGFAYDLWSTFKTGLLEKLNHPKNKTDALEFAAYIKNILTGCNCPDEIYTLLKWQTNAQIPDSLTQWQQRISELTQLVIQSQATIEKMNSLLQMINSIPNRHDQVILLAGTFREVTAYPHLQEIIDKSYEVMRKSLYLPHYAWELRRILAQHGESTWHLLINDFRNCFRPWPEHGRETLQKWQTHIFADFPSIVPLAANHLAEELKQGIPTIEELEFTATFLELVGESREEQCFPLLTAFLVKAPIEIAAARRPHWFDRRGLPYRENSRTKLRATLIALVKKIETEIANEQWNPHKASNFLNRWRRLQQELDQEVHQWASLRLLKLLGTGDLYNANEFSQPMQKCMRLLQEKGIQETLVYLKKESMDEPVTRGLQLIAIGQTLIKNKNVEHTEKKQWAEMIMNMTADLQPEQKDISWKILAEWAAAHTPPLEDQFREFKKMTEPPKWYQGIGSRLRNWLSIPRKAREKKKENISKIHFNGGKDA